MRIEFDRKKKTKEGGIVKQNQFKKWFQTKKIEIKRIGTKFEDKKKLRAEI
jgi:hypothetical protein